MNCIFIFISISVIRSITNSNYELYSINYKYFIELVNYRGNIFFCSQGTRLENASKNVNQPLYAFNVLQVLALPKSYRPPDGTYKKLQT